MINKPIFNEDNLSEKPAIEQLKRFGYTYVNGDELDPEMNYLAACCGVVHFSLLVWPWSRLAMKISARAPQDDQEISECDFL